MVPIRVGAFPSHFMVSFILLFRSRLLFDLTKLFLGTTVEVWGTNNPVSTTSGVNPTWGCLLDNVSFNATAPFTYPENNWLFCTKQQLSDGLHTITVNANSNGPTFWVDYIRYTPSASVSTQNAVVSVDNHDPAIIYDSSWGPLGTTSTFTTTTGAQMNFNFTGMLVFHTVRRVLLLDLRVTGTGLTWMAFIPTELSHNPTSATYSIDGGSPVTFPLNGLPSNSATVYNQIFFDVSGLSSGSHTLHVVHGGNNNTTPLSLVQLLVTDPSSSSSSPSSSNVLSTGGSPTSTSTTTNVLPNSPNSSHSNSTALPGMSGTISTHVPSSTSRSSNATGSLASSVNATSGSHSTPIGAIVGGAVGAFILILLILLLLLRRRQRKAEIRSPENMSPFMVTSAEYGISASNDPPTSALLMRDQVYDSWNAFDRNSRSVSTSECDPRVMRQGEKVAPAVHRVVHEDSGRRFRQQELIEDTPPGYSPD